MRLPCQGPGPGLLLALLLGAGPGPALAAAGPVQAQAQAMRPAQDPDPLLRLNDRFQAGYARAKAARQAAGGPVLLVQGDRWCLYRHQALVAEASFQPALFHRLKAVAHVPLALHLLWTTGAGPAPAERRELAELVRAARTELLPDFPPNERPRQARILEACARLLETPGPLPAGRLAAFDAELGPMLRANAEAAAGLELDRLHQGVTRLRGGLGPGEWGALRVVICGSHMARDGEVTLQYFCRLLGEAREGGRVVYAEGLRDPAAALDLLATHRVDAEAGAAFFADPDRMHRDVLADGAGRWLAAHPELGPAPGRDGENASARAAGPSTLVPGSPGSTVN
jgi:hypothetical protein